jgi:predicted dehydrogenase
MDRVRWAVIGAGGIADRRMIPEGIIPARNAELVAICDVSAELVNRVGEKYGVSPGQRYTSDVELIANAEVDAVYIATPNDLHRFQVLECAAAGRHVLCEKPLAIGVEECEELVEACAAAGVKLGVDFMMRFHRCHQKVKEMVDAGLLGRLVMGRAELTCWYPPIPGAFRQDPERGGGGSFIDMGNHCFDVLEMIFGPTRAVSMMTGNLVQEYAAEDTAVCLLQFESGAIGMVDALFNVPDAASHNALEVYGSQGSITARGTIGQASTGKLQAILEGGDRGYDAQQARAEAGEQIIEPEPYNIYQAHIEAFSDAVLNDTDPPVGGEDGLWNERVVEAAYEAARTGRVVEVEG